MSQRMLDTKERSDSFMQRWVPPVGDTLLNRYRLEEFLGHGPAGSVFRAMDLETGIPVAVKALHPDLFKGDLRAENTARLQAAKNYQHPNLNPILALHLDVAEGEAPLVISQLVDKTALRQVIHQRRDLAIALSHPEMRYVLDEVGKALGSIHQQGIHGNLKPENIFVNEEGLMLTDPCLLAGRTRLKRTPGEMPLRDHYLAAEQVRRGMEETLQSDIFALGMILGELAAGDSVRSAIPLSDQANEVPVLLDRLFLKATSDAPIDRHATIHDFLRETDRIFPEKAHSLDVEGADTQIVSVDDVLSPRQLAEIAAFNRSRGDTRATDRPTRDLPEFDLDDAMSGSTKADEDELDRTVVEDSETVLRAIQEAAASRESENTQIIPGIPNIVAAAVSEKTSSRMERRRSTDHGTPQRDPHEENTAPRPRRGALYEGTDRRNTPPRGHDLDGHDLDEDVVPVLPSEVIAEEEAIILEAAGAPMSPRPSRTGISNDPRGAALQAAQADATEAPTIDASRAEINLPPLPPPPPPPPPVARKSGKPTPRKSAAKTPASRPSTPGLQLDALRPYFPHIAVAVLAIAVLIMAVIATQRLSSTPPPVAVSDPTPEATGGESTGDEVPDDSSAKAAIEEKKETPEALPVEAPLSRAEKALKKAEAAADAARKAAEEAKNLAVEENLRVANKKSEQEAQKTQAETAEKNAKSAADAEAKALATAEKKEEKRLAKESRAVALTAEKERLREEADARTEERKRKREERALERAEARAEAKAKSTDKKEAAKEANQEKSDAKRIQREAARERAEKRKQDRAEAKAEAKSKAADEKKRKRDEKRASASEKKRLKSEAKSEAAEKKKQAKAAEKARKAEASAAKKTQDAQARKEEAAVAAAIAPQASNSDEKRTCMKGMKLITGKFTRKVGRRKVVMKTAYCIDYHEYPGKGRKPKRSVTWFQANAMCAGKGKRLCSKTEWSRACGSGKKYPYGSEMKGGRCNTGDDAGGEKPISRAGSKKKCKSPSGLYDMVGNVAEWTSNKTANGGSFKTEPDDANCYRAPRRIPSMTSSDVGFRCCADPD